MTDIDIPEDLIPPSTGVGIPWPVNGWDQVMPGLWQGGQLKRGASYKDQHVLVRDEFDRVFSFFWDNDGNGPDPGVWHEHYRIPDGLLSAAELAKVRLFALEVAGMTQLGDKVLVRCQAGYNRSGLVVGFALIEMGHTPREAIEMVRAARGPWALCNIHFVRYLLGASA